MGCGASEEIKPIEDLKEGDCLEGVKDLWLWDSPKAEKQVTLIGQGKMIKVLGSEVKEGPGNSGFIRVEALKCEGWVTIWARGGSTGNGPKAGFVKRINADGTPIAPKATGPALHDWKEDRAMGA